MYKKFIGNREVIKNMSLQNNTHTNKKLNKQEVGFGITNTSQQRLMNADGSSNFGKFGLPWYKTSSFYHFFITISWLHFFILIIFWFILINLVFTIIYFLLGSNHLVGMQYKTPFEHFMEVYFFSAQTLTTVGYGRVNPVGILTNIVSSFQALAGLLSFAVFTGLIYAKFSKPRSFLLFTNHALFSPYKNGYALMFRFANKLKYSIINVKVQVTLSIIETDEAGNKNRNFYSPINLERDHIQFFPGSWTIVHQINENSPIYGLTWEQIKESHIEIFILVSGFDESFDEQVHAKKSYHISEIVWGAKFTKIITTDNLGRTAVDLSKLDLFERVNLESIK